LHAAVAERFMLISRSPGILERVSARPAPNWIRIVSAEDLARVLARSGARIAMELDINPEWVQLAIASTPGGSLRAPIPGQVRSATQYLTGWTRDFITVLAAS
jgi:hypothetical protein